MSLDNIFERAKDIFEVAYRKTETVVNNQKQKLDIHALEGKLNKNYEVLGKACFGMLKTEGNFDKDSVQPIIDEINENILVLETAKAELLKSQNKNKCKNCGEAIDKNSLFCNKCGKKVE